MKNFFILRIVLLVSFFIMIYLQGWSAEIWENSITGTNPNTSNPYTTGQSVSYNITVSGIARGSGINSTNANDRYNATAWNTTSLDANDYFEFTLTPNSENKINFTSFVYTGQASGTGPDNFSFRSSLDNYSSDIGSATVGGTNIDLSSSMYQGIISSITFRMYAWGGTGGNFSINDFTFNGSVSPITPKYYQSVNSGDWNNTSTWQSSFDNNSWISAISIPSVEDKTITVQSGNTVTITNSISLDETIIGGTLQVQTGATLTINDDAGDDINILNNGILQVVSTSSYGTTIIPGTSVINISSGGKIQIGNGSVAVGSGYEAFATSTSNTWNNTSVFEWNTLTPFIFGGNSYFPNAAVGVIPSFIVTNVGGTIGNTSPVNLNGLLTVNSNFSLSGSGLKTLRDGITGTAQLTLNNSTGGYTISSPDATIGGSVSIILNENLRLASGATIPLGSTVNISGTSPNNIAKGSGGIFLINGTINMNSTSISNTSGNITVNGALKTSNANGLYGTGATIVSGTIVLNTNSTIEYNANGPQDVQGGTLPDYYNVIFSGSGIKTLLSTNDIKGNITISGSAIFNVGTHNFGTTSTNLTMTGSSKLIAGGTGIKPDIGGTYTLDAGTTIEFSNMATTLESIRLAPNYYNIVVSGTAVGITTLSSSIKIQSGGSFTVKGGATFKLQNTTGFSGGSSTAISNTNSPSIILENGSTVEYNGGDQTITNQYPYQNLTISGSGIKAVSASLLTIQGHLVKSGTSSFNPASGTVLLNGAAQTFAGLTYNNLILSGSGNKATNGNVIIMDSIKISSSTTLNIAANDTVTLNSEAFKTARVGQVDGAINYGTNATFVVERFIPARRAWRFLSVPVNTTQTVKEAWQEGATSSASNPVPFYGTQITDKVTPTASNGFDYYSPGGPSVKKFNSADTAWIGISGTKIPIETNEGLMTFVRGNRTSTGLYDPPTETTLRTSGQLYTGDQSFTINKGFTSIGNVYASAIDMRKITKADEVTKFDAFYLYDPNLNQLGGFQTFLLDNGNYLPTPGGGSYSNSSTPYNYIQSGQAFFVTSNTGGENLILKESAKASASLLAFRPFSGNSPDARFSANLCAIESNGDAVLIDGTLNIFKDGYSSTVDKFDAIKMENFEENIAVKTDNRLLTIEKRNTIAQEDTIQLNMLKMKVKSYRFEFKGQNFDPAISAFLEDSYNNSRTPLDINVASTYNFTVEDIPGSWNPARFRVVFKAAAGGPLPVTFISLKASQQSRNIRVEWNVGNEKNIKEYVIEKSPDAQHFTIAKIISAKNASSGTIKYEWLDENTFSGANYYRIRSVNVNSELQYSSIVNVVLGRGVPQILINPNPIIGNVINLQLINQPKDNFNLQLLNTTGQLISAHLINHQGGSSSETITINKALPKGIYFLKITGGNNNEVLLKLIR